jgi:hypothetical protein
MAVAERRETIRSAIEERMISMTMTTIRACIVPLLILTLGQAMQVTPTEASDAKAKMDWPKYHSKMCMLRWKNNMRGKPLEEKCAPYMKYKKPPKKK